MKSKKAQGMNQVILTIIIALIVLIAVAIPIGVDLAITQQQIQSVSLEQVTNSNFNQTVTLANPKIDGTVTLLNATGSSSASVEDTPRLDVEYQVNARPGQILFFNRTGTWNVSYDYKPTSYAESQTTRTVLGILVIFLAIIAIVIVSRMSQTKQ